MEGENALLLHLNPLQLQSISLQLTPPGTSMHTPRSQWVISSAWRSDLSPHSLRCVLDHVAWPTRTCSHNNSCLINLYTAASPLPFIWRLFFSPKLRYWNGILVSRAILGRGLEGENVKQWISYLGFCKVRWIFGYLVEFAINEPVKDSYVRGYMISNKNHSMI